MWGEKIEIKKVTKGEGFAGGDTNFLRVCQKQAGMTKGRGYIRKERSR